MRHALLLVALLGTACGPVAGAWLQVDAPLLVPDDCDALRVQAFRGTAAGPVLLDRTYDLTHGPSFPVTLSLTTQDSADVGPLVVTVTAQHAGALARPWATATGQVQLVKGTLAPLHLHMCDCQ